MNLTSLSSSSGFLAKEVRMAPGLWIFFPYLSRDFAAGRGPMQKALQASAQSCLPCLCGRSEWGLGTYIFYQVPVFKVSFKQQKNERPLLEHLRPVAKCFTSLCMVPALHGPGVMDGSLWPSPRPSGLVSREDWSPQSLSYPYFHCVHSLVSTWFQAS